MSNIIDPNSLKIATAVRTKGGAHGAVIFDGVQVGDTLQCPHCNRHFLSIRGSGHRRTFCMKCREVTCGELSCDPCVPFALRIDLCDKIPGLTIDTVPAYLDMHPEIRLKVGVL